MANMYNLSYMRTRGFTLVELLITIAIIGILAATILTSLNDARIEGVSAKIKTEMDAIANRASVEQTQVGTYDIVCGTNSYTQSADIAELIASINTLASTSAVCNSGPSAYAVSVGLADTHWCIDNTGTKGEVATALTTSPPQLTCP